MPELFTGGDILNIGIEAEVLGEQFYTGVAGQATDRAVGEICERFAGEEREHARLLRQMSGEWEGAQTKLQASEETMDYVRALVGQRMLPKADDAQALISGAKGLPDLFAIAANLERDSILFYYEMRDLVGTAAGSVVDRIIGEEKAHLATVQRMAVETR